MHSFFMRKQADEPFFIPKKGGIYTVCIEYLKKNFFLYENTNVKYLIILIY